MNLSSPTIGHGSLVVNTIACAAFIALNMIAIRRDPAIIVNLVVYLNAQHFYMFGWPSPALAFAWDGIGYSLHAVNVLAILVNISFAIVTLVLVNLVACAVFNRSYSLRAMHIFVIGIAFGVGLLQVATRCSVVDKLPGVVSHKDVEILRAKSAAQIR
jgi:apolipoprotein N-acyltransferase